MTYEFHCRIVQWVKERQCDQRTGIPRHDAIPDDEVAEYSESHDRLTANKRDHTGGKALRESERTIHVMSPTFYQSNSSSQHASTTLNAPQNNHQSEAMKHINMKPTSLQTSKRVGFSYSTEKADHGSKQNNDEKEIDNRKSDDMSAHTDNGTGG